MVFCATRRGDLHRDRATMKTPVVLVTAALTVGDPAGGVVPDRHGTHARSREALRRLTHATGISQHRRGAASIRYSISFDSNIGKLRRCGQPLFNASGAKSPPHDATIGQAAALTLVTTRTGMQFDWRAISGPALTAATALIAILVDRLLVAIPNPAPLFVCIVAFAGSLSGLASGMISAAIAVACSRAVLPRPPRHARLRHRRSGPAVDAGDDRGRHRRHHRPAAARN